MSALRKSWLKDQAGFSHKTLPLKLIMAHLQLRNSFFFCIIANFYELGHWSLATWTLVHLQILLDGAIQVTCHTTFHSQIWRILLLIVTSEELLANCDGVEACHPESQSLSNILICNVVDSSQIVAVIVNRAFSRQFFPQKFWVKSESTPVFLSKNLSLERKIATNLNSRQKYAFRTNIEFSRKCIYLQLKPI